MLHIVLLQASSRDAVHLEHKLQALDRLQRLLDLLRQHVAQVRDQRVQACIAQAHTCELQNRYACRSPICLGK